MKLSLHLLAALTAFTEIVTFGSIGGAQPQPAQRLHNIDVVRLDPEFDKLVPANVVVERIVSGRKWVEGPVWNRREGVLLFSDVPANAVIQWQEGKGTRVHLEASGYSGKTSFDGPEPGSNGLTFDHDAD